MKGTDSKSSITMNKGKGGNLTGRKSEIIKNYSVHQII
jgi:hypothetical protein